MRAATYRRVSTAGQADDGYGLDVQAKALRAYCKAHGLTIVAEHEDAGLSGSLEAVDRPGLLAAIQSVGPECALVVPKLDRLARTLTIQEATLATVWRRGAVLHCCDTGIVAEDDKDDPMRTFVRQVMGAAAQLERGMIYARTAAGKRAKADKGLYAGYGRPGFGFKVEDGRIVEDPAEQAVLEMVEAWRAEPVKRATGKVSVASCAARLNALGIPAKQGGKWHGQRLAVILAQREQERSKVG